MIKKERKIIRAPKKTDPMANRKEVHLEDDIISITATEMYSQVNATSCQVEKDGGRQGRKTGSHTQQIGFSLYSKFNLGGSI